MTQELQDSLGNANRQLQRGLLPRNAPSLRGYDIAGGTSVTEAGRGVTIWDAFSLGDQGIALLSLDAPGNSPMPAHHLAMARLLFREFARDGRELRSLVPRVNEALHGAAVEGIEGAVQAGVMVLGDEAMEWASAGQPMGGVIRRDGTFLEFASHGPPLGMLGGFKYGTQTVPLRAGDMVLVLSRASQGLFRGAADLLVSLQNKAAGEVVSTLHRAIRKAQAAAPEEMSVLFVRKH